MSMLELFIRRRIGTALLAIGMLLLGAVAYGLLPVAPLPQVDFPTIEVQAFLPGASADTMASAVATPLERNFGNIAGISEMSSSSSLGVSTITLQFDLGRDINAAAQDVQTQIAASNGLLPRALPSPPVYHKVNPADFTILSLALTSDTLPLTRLDSVAEDLVATQVSQIPGVGLVDYHGQLRPSVRVRLDPDRVAALGLTFEDVRAVIGAATVDAPKGSLDGANRAVILNATDQIVSAGAYAGLVVAWRGGLPIHLGDIASVIDAPENIRQAAWLQDRRAIVIDIHKQPGFNVVDTIARIKARLPAIVASIPAAATLTLVGDRTQTIQASVDDVQVTLLLTGALVVAVIFAFLRNGWATIIPALTIPLALVSTFGGMYLLGYSLDNLSLMALTISVGFVVDDAIVVIENVMRHLEAGSTRLRAAIEGAREVSFTVLSMSVSLIAVFVPVLLMGGIVGRLFREFAMTVSIAILVSCVISLTVTPMLCGWLLRHHAERPHGRAYRVSEWLLVTLTRGYARMLDRVLRHQRATLGVAVAILAATVWLYAVSPKGFLPQEDAGLIQGLVQAEPDVSFEAMARRIRQVGAIAAADPDIENAYYYIGPVPTVSQGHIFLNLKPFAQRRSGAAAIMARLKTRFRAVSGVTVGMQIKQDIQIGGIASAAQYQYTLRGADVAQLDRFAADMQHRMAALPMLRDVASDRQPGAESATLDIDRATAARLGVSVQAIDDVLYDAFGQRQVATLFTALNQYHVVEEADPRFALSTDGLSHLFVRSTLTNQPVPLSMLATVRSGLSPISINHAGSFPAVTLSFNLAPGHALSEAVAAIGASALAAHRPDGVTASFQGTAQAFQDSMRSEPWLILAALIAIYIVLGVLYESAIHPLTILSTLPSAGFGALVALRLAGLDLSVIGLISILLLIGIVKKNAIMMIDFALVAEREHGLSPEAAIRQACLLRFRPIMMTTMAALLGAVPLAIGTGPGAEFRVPLGVGIVGGLIVSQAVTLFTTPVVYLWFDRLRSARRGAAARDSEPEAGLVRL